MTRKNIIITGSNAGIGFATALALAKQGGNIIMVCRNQERGVAAQKELIQQSGNQNVTLFLADLSAQQQIHRLARELKQAYPTIDVLINNAGGVFSKRMYSEDGIEMQFATNHLNYFLLTHLLLPTIERSKYARIINVASDSHYQGKIYLDDLNLEKQYYFILKAYCQSKLANVLFTYELDRLLRQRKSAIVVNALHPGTIQTTIGSKAQSWLHYTAWYIRSRFGGSLEEGAATSVYLASAEAAAGISGKYFDKCKSKKSSKLSYDENLAKQLWQKSLELTKVEDYFVVDS